ncbi:MAG: sulfurtransferase TusA family protein [Deltaproteobacteria bacterium]|nr:sulfurtransferase TusA family protein [Deltaproteobacteria bacterium]
MAGRGSGKKHVVDTTGSVCPMTFVLAKMAIDEMDDGEEISIRLNEGEAVSNVPRSLKEEGHKILKLVDNGDGTYDLRVRKAEPVAGTR